MKWKVRRSWLWAAICVMGGLAAAGWMMFSVFWMPVGCAQEDLSTRFVTVTAAQNEEEPTQKRVYLTFDDGPSPTTETVLEILQQKQVKATFFVIAAENNREYLPLIRKAVEQGHQIALHSCTHDYKSIYASTTAFWADIKELRQQIAPYVDVEKIQWIRFPGGSTNTVSHKYGGSGIMKTLKQQAEEKGYRYIDWNVCANDAIGGHPSANTIYHNVVDSVNDKKEVVVLMHDTKATKTTAEALPDMIDWFLEQGFEFCVLDQMGEKQPKAE